MKDWKIAKTTSETTEKTEKRNKKELKVQTSGFASCTKRVFRVLRWISKNSVNVGWHDFFASIKSLCSLISRNKFFFSSSSMDFEEFDDVVWRDFFASSVVRLVRKFQLQNFWRLFHEKLSDNNFFSNSSKDFQELFDVARHDFLASSVVRLVRKFQLQNLENVETFPWTWTPLSSEFIWQQFFFEFFNGFPRILRCSLGSLKSSKEYYYEPVEQRSRVVRCTLAKIKTISSLMSRNKWLNPSLSKPSEFFKNHSEIAFPEFQFEIFQIFLRF